jgi:hypothetical protein
MAGAAAKVGNVLANPLLLLEATSYFQQRPTCHNGRRHLLHQKGMLLQTCAVLSFAVQLYALAAAGRLTINIWSMLLLESTVSKAQVTY